MIKTNEENDVSLIINDYLLNGLSATKLAEKYGYKPRRIYTILAKNKVKMRNKSEMQRKYSLNEHYFDVIDDEHKAYWLGWLYSDGSLTSGKNAYEISLKLAEVDKEILDKIKIDLNSGRPLYKIIRKNDPTRQDAYDFRISSKHMFETLVKLGCPPAKSLILQFPTENQVPKHLLRHWLRGVVDGDGCVGCEIRKRQNNYPSGCLSIVTTFDMSKGIQNYIKNELFINSSIVMTKNGITCNFKIAGNKQYLSVIDWLYKDATIYLERKFQTKEKVKKLIEDYKLNRNK